jgi:hypothetical protein
MPSNDDLLSQLMNQPESSSPNDPLADPASPCDFANSDASHDASDETLDALLNRIHQLAAGETSDTAATAPSATPGARLAADSAADCLGDDDPFENPFLPIEPASFHEAGLNDSEVEALILKFLFARGDASGRDIADQLKLPFVLIGELMRQIKTDQLVVLRGSAPMNDYQYELTDLGRERSRRLVQHCTYFGSAPVALRDYIAAVTQQSLTKQHPTRETLDRAFSGILLNRKMLDRLGPAVNSGRGLFLYGAPGNGKTSIAERVTAAFGRSIWIPRAIGVDGEILRLFDPTVHEEMPLPANEGLIDSRRIDRRWIRIRRPTIIAAGELTMESLEVTINKSTGVSESPLQLKSNCGTLVIDDFGRQRIRVEELLNRWIVPLEKHYDYLSLPNGKKVQVPFDQLLVFSTNLEPKDLVDEAFLRRIPYKIEVINPTETEFRSLFKFVAEKFGMGYSDEAITHLIQKHYKATGRPFRFCQPRDLVLQICNYCAYRSMPLEMTPEYFDIACENYFAVMAPN